MFDCILFDLDGTLTDSFEGITNSVIYALNRLGETHPDRNLLKSFIGPPLSESFTQRFNGDTEKAAAALEYYREYYTSKGIFENSVYDGIPQMLATLKAMGKRLFVATSKPEPFARKITDHFGLARYFEYVAGASFDKSRENKDQVIAYALATTGIDKQRSVMVGDRQHDITGAKNNGLKSIGVLYGYGSESELKKFGADYIIAAPSDLLKII